MRLKSKQIRRNVNYDASQPRCALCVHYDGRKTVLRNSLPVCTTAAHCKLHLFSVLPMAVCDTWQDKKGNVLDI